MIGYRARQEVMALGRGGVRQGAGCPSNGSTGATVSIFLGWDSEARELHAEMEVFHSFRALRGRSHNVLRERPRE